MPKAVDPVLPIASGPKPMAVRSRSKLVDRWCRCCGVPPSPSSVSPLLDPNAVDALVLVLVLVLVRRGTVCDPKASPLPDPNDVE